MNDPHQHPSEQDPLDDLLAGARWPEPSPASQRRLEQRWLHLARQRRRRQRWAAALATAAGLLIAAGVALQLTTDGTDQPGQTSESIATAPPRESDDDDPTENPPAPSGQQPQDPEEDAFVREPTPLEAQLARLAHQQPAPRKEASQPDPLRRRITEAIDRIAERTDRADIPAEAEKLVDRAPSKRQLQRHLIRSARDGSDNRRLAAARLLAEVATEQALPDLVKLAEEPALRRVLLPAIGPLCNVEQLAALIERWDDEPARRRLMIELAGRDTRPAVERLLALAQDSRMRPLALAAAEEAPLPLDRLLDYFDDPHVEKRLAAACLIGRAADLPTLRRLARMIERDEHRRPAIAAMVCSENEQAAAFLNLLRKKRGLASVVQSLEHRMKSKPRL